RCGHVTRTHADSPYQVCTDLIIPRRGTVNVEPGVQVNFQGHGITVLGVLNAQGEPATHITFTAQGFSPIFTLQRGTTSTKFTDVTGQIRGGPGKMTISDTTFIGPNGLIYTFALLLRNVHAV